MSQLSLTGSSARVVVVGAGVFGCWTAEHLRRAGHQVTLIDTVGPAHALATSGGHTRLTRAAYGPASVYSRMAFDSLREWKALGQRCAMPIFLPCGVLFFSATPGAYFARTLAVNRDLGLEMEVLDRRQLARRFPAFDFSDIELGLFEPAFGALMARRAVQELLSAFVELGGSFVVAKAAAPAGTGIVKDLALSNGGKVEADAFVFAAGPWLGGIFPDLLGQRIIPTRQEIFYFAAPGDSTAFSADALPGWAELSHDDFYYGLPDLEGKGVKFAHHSDGPIIDPDTQSRQPTEEALREIVAYRDRRFPSLAGGPLNGAEICQYENSSSGDFLVDFHPDMPNLLLVGGGSGHGFKHGPEVGRYAASRLSGGGWIEPRFSLESKGAVPQRAVF